MICMMKGIITFMILSILAPAEALPTNPTPKGESSLTVSIEPAELSVGPGGTGSFSVHFNTLTTPVGSYDIVLNWTPGVFTINSVSAGSSSEFGAPINNIDNTSGQLDIADFQASSLSQPTGTFTVATVQFTAGSSGTSDIDLLVEELSDTNALPIVATTFGGIFTITGGETPTPSNTQEATPTHTPGGIPTAVHPELDYDSSGRIGPEDLLVLLGEGMIPEELLSIAIDWQRPLFIK